MDRARIEQLLGREFAQRDHNFLEYSVPREDIMANIRDKNRQFFLIVAPRGSGKSGLLLMLQEELRTFSKNSSTIILKYYEDVQFPERTLPIDASLQYWIKKFLIWIIAEIGTQIDIPKTPDEIYAVELAEHLGVRVSDAAIAPRGTLDDSGDRLRAVAKRLLAISKRTFWLLLDEMDDIYSNTTARNHALVGLLQACDAVAKLSSKIVVRLTIRPHIHTYLKTHFDVVQKFRDSELYIYWNEVELRAILVRRIQRFNHVINRLQPEFQFEADPPAKFLANREACSVIGHYFEDFDLGFGAEKTSDYRALQTISLRRPRWMIEFCWLALQNAPDDYASRDSFIRAMHEFGRNRIQFLAGEHQAHLPELTSWVNRLASARKVSFGTSEEFCDIIVEHVIREAAEDLTSKPATPQEKAAALHIAQSLYMLEIVRAHQFVGGKDNHRFYTYADAPELLETWSTRANMTWQMHETFARALNIIDNHTFRVGGEIRLFGDRRPGQTGAKQKRSGSRRRRRQSTVQPSST